MCTSGALCCPSSEMKANLRVRNQFSIFYFHCIVLIISCTYKINPILSSKNSITNMLTDMHFIHWHLFLVTQLHRVYSYWLSNTYLYLSYRELLVKRKKNIISKNRANLRVRNQFNIFDSHSTVLIIN